MTDGGRAEASQIGMAWFAGLVLMAVGVGIAAGQWPREVCEYDCEAAGDAVIAVVGLGVAALGSLITMVGVVATGVRLALNAESAK